MAIYSELYLVPADTTKKFDLSIEGDLITHVRLRFPPGPQGTLKFAIFYGLRQIFPYEPDTWFYGDDEIIEWDEWFELPEYYTKLEILAVNEDTKNDHTFYLVLVTMIKENTLSERIGQAVSLAVKRRT